MSKVWSRDARPFRSHGCVTLIRAQIEKMNALVTREFQAGAAKADISL